MLQSIFHGHSFVEVFYDQSSILIDPFVNGNSQCDLSIDTLLQKDIKLIVVTHGHSDHIGDAIEIAKAKGCMVIATFELANHLKSKGVENIHAMHIGGEYIFDNNIGIKLVNAVHGGGGVGVACGIILRVDGKSIYHAGDTALTYDMQLLGEYDNIDLAFLPIGGNFTMGVADAVIATSFIKPGIVVPIHYNTWDVISADPTEFARLVMTDNLSKPKVLTPGQLVQL